MWYHEFTRYKDNSGSINFNFKENIESYIGNTGYKKKNENVGNILNLENATYIFFIEKYHDQLTPNYPIHINLTKKFTVICDNNNTLNK